VEKRSIARYHLSLFSEQIIALPRDTKILSVTNIYCSLYFFADTDTNCTHMELYKFILYRTGNYCNHDKSYTFLGTATLSESEVIIHVFYKKLS
jgi:hypothetical protein